MWMAGWCRVEGRAGHSGICGVPHPPRFAGRSLSPLAPLAGRGRSFSFCHPKRKTAVTEDSGDRKHNGGGAPRSGMRGSIPRCISPPLSIIVPPGCFRQVRPRLAVLSLRHLLGPVRHMPMRTASSTLGAGGMRHSAPPSHPRSSISATRAPMRRGRAFGAGGAGTIGTVVNTVGLGPHRIDRASRPGWFFERDLWESFQAPGP
jgi:hypothetical protein